MSQETLQEILKQFDYVREHPSTDCDAIQVPAQYQRAFFEKLKTDYKYELLVDVTAIDWDQDSPRFTVVYHLYCLVQQSYLRVRVDCEDDASPSVQTISDLWPSADWHERETFDMFGITFEKHPNLKRILMWEGYPYHPLRKEFPLAGHEVELPAADVAERTGAKVESAPMMGGPFVASTGGHMADSEPRAKDQSWTEDRAKPKG